MTYIDILSRFLYLTVSNSSKPQSWLLEFGVQITNFVISISGDETIWNPLKSRFGLVKSKHVWANPGATDSESRKISVLWWENHRKIMEKKQNMMVKKWTKEWIFTLWVFESRNFMFWLVDMFCLLLKPCISLFRFATFCKIHFTIYNKIVNVMLWFCWPFYWINALLFRV